MRYYSVCLYADMIIGRIIPVGILPGVQADADRWGYSFKTHSLTGSAYAGADRLQHKHDAIGSITIGAAEKYIKDIIERKLKIDLVGVPDTSALCGCGRRKCIAIAGVLRC